MSDDLLTVADLVAEIDWLQAALARVTDYATVHAAIGEAYADDEVAGIVNANRFIVNGRTAEDVFAAIAS